MARHKEFDRDQALAAAIDVFAQHGYEGTSTDELLTAMKISRQSMYDTFGDKRSLYLEALGRYNAESVAIVVADLRREGSPLKALEAALLAFASRSSSDARRCCLGVSAICEFGRTDVDIAELTDRAGHVLHSALEGLLADARKAGEIGQGVEIGVAAQFLAATLAGMKVSARNGAGPQTLSAIAHMAIRSLR